MWCDFHILLKKYKGVTLDSTEAHANVVFINNIKTAHKLTNSKMLFYVFNEAHFH